MSLTFRDFNNLNNFFFIQNFHVKADEAKVNFIGTGVGAQGMKEYKFTLDLLNEIVADKIKSIRTGNKIDIFLPKVLPGFWSRLVRSIIIVQSTIK